MHRFLLALIVATLLTTGAQAHVATSTIEAEDHVLQDEWTDNGLWDGFDILDVYIREAHFAGGDGIVVRWGLYGGSSGGYITDHVVQLEFDNAQTVSWSSNDNGQTWTGPGEVLDVQYDPEASVPVVNIQFQGFVPYDALGVSIGDSLDGVTATALAGGFVVDTAPGGYHFYGVEITDPTAAPDSMRLIESLPLDGPDRYTATSWSLDGNELSLHIDNLIESAGQHVFVSTSLDDSGGAHLHDEEGNHVGGGFELEPGVDLNVTLELDSVDGVEVYVVSDLGGREVLTLTGSPEAEDKDTPAVPLLLVIAALALLGRRR